MVSLFCSICFTVLTYALFVYILQQSTRTSRDGNTQQQQLPMNLLVCCSIVGVVVVVVGGLVIMEMTVSINIFVKCMYEVVVVVAG